MNRSYNKIPVYTGDVSGAASALYELGGMLVIHDPSGCNSTYNTHDEIRWYDQESLIYITGLNHVDAIMGNDKKVVNDVVRAAKELKPEFIALVSSPIPYMNGTDFKAICRLIEQKTQISTFFVETNGMHDYSVGAGNAFGMIAEQISGKKKSDGKKRINLLGVTPLDFADQNSVIAMKEWLSDCGWDDICCFAMGDTLEHLQEAKNAEVSLVVSSTGLKAAKSLEKRYQIPFVCGTPVNGMRDCILNTINKTIKTGKSMNVWDEVQSIPVAESEEKVTLIGEPVIMESLAASIRQHRGIATEVITTLEQMEDLLMQSDACVKGEEAVEEILQKADTVIGDPMYRMLCKREVTFIEMPHLAFSGRCYIRKMKNVVEEAIYEQFK